MQSNSNKEKTNKVNKKHFLEEGYLGKKIRGKEGRFKRVKARWEEVT